MADATETDGTGAHLGTLGHYLSLKGIGGESIPLSSVISSLSLSEVACPSV